MTLRVPDIAKKFKRINIGMLFQKLFRPIVLCAIDALEFDKITNFQIYTIFYNKGKDQFSVIRSKIRMECAHSIEVEIIRTTFFYKV